MDSVGSLIANQIKLSKQIESYPNYPNVIALHPTIDTYNSHNNNVIAIVDLAQQGFQIKNQSQLNSYWWLSFKSYCAQCEIIFSQFINNNNANNSNENDNNNDNDNDNKLSDKQEMDTDTDHDNKIDVEYHALFKCIFEFISVKIELTCDHHIAELFIENHFETDSLISLNTPQPKQNFNFDFTYSDDNPYANMEKLKISNDQDTKKEDQDQEEEEEEEMEMEMDMDYKIEFIRADINNNLLYKWFSLPFPSIISPQTTSRESPQNVYNDMLAHWECRLSQDNRFLLIFPEKLGEVCDVYLTKQGKIYWIQSLNSGDGDGDGKENKENLIMNRRRIFTLNECNVTQQFECKVIKLLISTEEPARFKIMPCTNNNIIIWNFSINGASNDLFSVIGKSTNNNYKSTNNVLNNKICAIDNAQNFSNYRFKGGNLKDLIRDSPKLCSVDGSIIFSGACFLSVLNDINKIHIYTDNDDDGDGRRLITNQVSCGFCYDAWIPVSICEAKDTSRWITDYIPFKNKSILGRWQGDICKSVYGIWTYNQKDKKWKCMHSKQYDDMKWNSCIMGCYHFGDRIKTILLSIELQGKH